MPVDSRQREGLTNEGYCAVPTQWVEIDKNDCLRRPDGPNIAPQYESSLEEALGKRADSPTCELEGLRLNNLLSRRRQEEFDMCSDYIRLSPGTGAGQVDALETSR